MPDDHLCFFTDPDGRDLGIVMRSSELATPEGRARLERAKEARRLEPAAPLNPQGDNA